MIGLQQAAETALRILLEDPLAAYDTETSGLDWKRNVPIGYVVTSGDGKKSVYVPIRHGGGGNLPDPTGKVVPLTEAAPAVWAIHPFEVELAKAFKERQRLGYRTVGHHIQFDAHFSANAGVMLGRNLSCTQNNETLIYEYTRSYSLDALAKEYKVTVKLGQPLYNHLAELFGGAATKAQMGNYWKTCGTDPIVYDYAAGDGVSTIEVYHKQAAEMLKQELGLVWDIENKLIWTLFRMERRGIPLDMDYLDRLVATIDGRIEEAQKALPDGFNPRSGPQMKALMEGAGRTDWPTTEKGNPSFKANWLKTFPQGQLVVALREQTNLLSSFVLPLRDEHAFNGRVHASIRQNKADEGGTISGRLACSDPNLMATPKHNKPLASMLRRAFVADEGMVFCEADYSQLEPRLFAQYSKDEALLNGYNNKPFKDVHTLVAEMLNVDRGTTGKRMNMGMFTGMQPKSFAGHMDMPIGEATKLWNAWNAAFPAIRPFQNKAKAVIKSRGYVKTFLGRRGRLEHPRFAYVATSKIIQGGNADILKYKLVEIDVELEKMEEAWLVMSIHDSLLWMAPKGQRGQDINAWISNAMIDTSGEPFNLIVPTVIELDQGDSWAEASFGEAARQYYA